jgi:WD40 repeat protein
MRIEYQASKAVTDAMQGIVRSEDIRFSPDGKRLAVVDFIDEKILVFAINLQIGRAIQRVELTDYMVLSSRALNCPHGIAFIDNKHFVVANRNGQDALFTLPVLSKSHEEVTLDPLCRLEQGKGSNFSISGSLDCYPLGSRRHRILTCNNYINTVSSHEIRIGEAPRFHKGFNLLSKNLKVPDGISISNDRRWIIVSNHIDGQVFVYENTPELGEQSEPVGILVGAVCPHGLRFSPDGRHIVVADAASPFLHLYSSEDGHWPGHRRPDNSVRIMDDATFMQARANAQEGGLKGIAFDPSGKLLATTTRNQVLTFYDFDKLRKAPRTNTEGEISRLCQERDSQLRQPKFILAHHILAYRHLPSWFFALLVRLEEHGAAKARKRSELKPDSN